MMIEIWGKQGCWFCDAAKRLCQTKNIDYIYKQLDEDFTREEIFKKFPDARTFPQIIELNEANVLNEILYDTESFNYIGGYTEFTAWVQNNSKEFLTKLHEEI